MTEAEFFKQLKKVRGSRWTITNGSVRCEQGDCPMAALARRLKKKKVSTNEWEETAKELGVTPGFASAIVDAADQTHAEYVEDQTSYFQYESDTNRKINRHRRLRKRLLDAIGLGWAFAIENGK